MLTINVLLEIQSSLFNGLPIYVTNVAIVLLVVKQLISQISETGKGVKHDTWNNVTEKNAKEDTINRVINESHCFEGLHGFSYGTWDEELQNTI